VAILRFDSEANLQTWLDSPQRQALPCESEPLVEEFHARIVRSGFDQWFPGSGGAAAGPPVWKQNMVVLLMLYPVVFLFGRYTQTPYLMGSAHIPFWAATLFIGNIASVVLLLGRPRGSIGGLVRTHRAAEALTCLVRPWSLSCISSV
jgi:antibiotic biosynthesis monooxygenase (ABM) superfamily enzyme